MIQVGQFNSLKIIRDADFGYYLDDGDKGILLPNRYIPAGAQLGDVVSVFIYHDNEGRPIATTLTPHGIAGDIVYLQCVDTSPIGAFLDNGLMKHLFVPKQKQNALMQAGKSYLVKVYIDAQTGRMVASAKLKEFINNDILTVKEKDIVGIVIARITPLGYEVIINQTHWGLLYHNQTFSQLAIGDRAQATIQTIYENNKIDVTLGKQGYERVIEQSDPIINLLKENNGFLPYNDKTPPEKIYAFFQMSKKTFKMAIGNLYKQKKILISDKGISLIQE